MSHVSSYYQFHVSDELHVLDLGSVVDISAIAIMLVRVDLYDTFGI